MYVDDVNVHVKGDVNEVEEMREHIRANLTNDVGLLQLKMSGTEKGKDGKTNMLLPNSILVSRLQKVGAKKRELELSSLLRTGVPSWRHVESVEDRSGAHEHIGVRNRKRHAMVQTVAVAGMVRCAGSCWRSHPYMQQHGKRRGSQLRLGADFVAKLWQCTEH